MFAIIIEGSIDQQVANIAQAKKKCLFLIFFLVSGKVGREFY